MAAGDGAYAAPAGRAADEDASYDAQQVEEDANGKALQETLDNNNGSHTMIGLGAAEQTFTTTR